MENVVMRWIGIFRRASGVGMAAAIAFSVTIDSAMAAEPRLNQIQVIGTHNSYHIPPAEAIYELVASAGTGGGP